MEEKLKLITQSDRIKSVAKRWRKQYPIGCDKDKEQIYQELLIKKPQTEKEIVNIIGNNTWTNGFCDECARYCSATIEIEHTTICTKCITKAFNLIKKRVIAGV